MKIISFSRSTMFLLLLAWWSVFAFLLFSPFTSDVLLNIVGFSFAIIVPGFLTMTALRIGEVGFWPRAGMMVGFSVLEIILLALIGNAVLPNMGVVQPLSTPIIFAELSFFVLALFFIAITRGLALHLSPKKYYFFATGKETFYAFLPLLFILLSVLGAVRLNNGGTNTLTILMLFAMGIFTTALVFQAKKEHELAEEVIPTALYFMALALLLMTSLRGWHTTGHDVQTEFYVFELAKHSGAWIIDTYRNAYNACMSITILPTALSALSRISDPYIYKVFFQIIFAFMAPLVYAIIRRYVDRSMALLAAFYFMAFPTFFSDMPMLNRQEIAFVFWALMVFLMGEARLSLITRQGLFIIFGLGVILSHYSTTYTVIALLIALMLARPLVLRLVGFFKEGKFLHQSAMVPEEQRSLGKVETVATPWVVVILCLMTFLWSSVLTDTSSGSITRVIAKTFEAMRNATHDDTRSGDVFYGLFSWRSLDKEAALKEYQKKVVAPAREKAQEGTYYDLATYDAFPVVVANDSPGELTALGKAVTDSDAGAAKIHYVLRQIFAKLLQVLIVIGFAFTLFRRSLQQKVFGLEFSLLSVVSLLFVASQVLLPVLSSEYGVFRAFQQSLIFLGVSIVIGSMALFVRFGSRVRLVAATVFAVFFFYSMTGVVTQAFLKNPPQLHLSNSGQYYDLYYTHENDLRGAAWMEAHIPKVQEANIQTDRADYNDVRSISGVTILNGIYPELIRTDAYVFLNDANTQKRVSTVLWNSDVIGYTYPLGFLDAHKNLLYSNGSVEIYK